MTIPDASGIYSDVSTAVRRWDRALRKSHGVTFVQAMILSAIDRCAAESMEWPRPVDVSHVLHIESQTLTGSIDRLAKLGLVYRKAHEADRRSSRLVFTSAGYDKAEELREVQL